MSENLENFLVDLSSNPDQLSRFKKSPEDVVAQSALSSQERGQVMTRDSRVVADALGATGFALGEGVGVITPSRKAPARKKRPVKKTPAKKKAPARKKTPARKPAPAKKKTPARKQSPAKRKAPARKKSAAKKSPRKATSRKRR